MKKNRNFWVLSHYKLKKLIMELKLAILILVFSVTNVFAVNTYSQVARVTLDLENKPLEQVMDEIERQSEFYFIFNQKQIDVNRVVNIKAENELVSDLLPELFTGTNINCTVLDRKILLTVEPFISLSDNTSMKESQQITVRGTVTDGSTGDALPGVNVVIKGTTAGSITDVDGSFSLQVSNASATLVFSFIGYVTQEVSLSGRTSVNVALVPDVEELSEVVVVGYGTQLRREVTGAISSVKSENLIKSAQTSFTQALRGKVPGLSALQNTGQPGAGPDMRIRSNPSFASSGVLFVLDGIPVNDNAGEPSSGTLYGSAGINRTSLNFINPNDIESIQVLKDAAASSIYGARAGAGVILITTKRGMTGKPRINYDASYAIQKPTYIYEVMNTKDYMLERNRIKYDMWLRDNKIDPYGSSDPSGAPPFVPVFTDQEINTTIPQPSAPEAISRTGFTNQHNLSLSGGTSETKYYISSNFLDQKGVLISSGFQRFNNRINVDQKIGNKIVLGVNVTTSNSKAENANIGDSYAENSSMITAAIDFPPYLRLYADENGEYMLNPDYVNKPNPISYDEVYDFTNTKRLLTAANAEWTIIKGLKAKGSFSFDQSTAKRNVYFPKNFLKGYTSGGTAAITERNTSSRLIEYTLNYLAPLGENHKLDFLAGYSYQLTTWDGINLSSYNFLTDEFLYNNIGAGAAPRPTIGSSKSEQKWASYFARANYAFNGKYLLSAVVRRDGSSIFAKNKKYGIFPSVSLGWIVSEEPFWNDNMPLGFLKFRTSYGTTGNSNIGSNAFAYYSTGYNYVFNNDINSGVYLSQLNNDNLTWETVKEFNIGIDYQILNNRISGTIDYFNKTVNNLLTFRPLPTSFPVSSVADNVGKTRSVGWELGIESRNFISNSGGFEWNTQFTISHYEDNWVERSPQSLAVLAKYIDPKGPFNPIYRYRHDGMYTKDRPAPTWMPGIIQGTVVLKDFNGYDENGELTGEPDGQITDADYVLVGVWDPKFTFGLTNTLSYKNISLSVYMYGASQKKDNGVLAEANGAESGLAQFGENGTVYHKDRWSYNNQTSNLPSGLSNKYSSQLGSSDFYLKDATFLRCQDITAAFTIPSRIIQKQNAISGIRLSFAIQNAFVLSGFKDLDPELANWMSYPNPRSFIFGLNASF